MNDNFFPENNELKLKQQNESDIKYAINSEANLNLKNDALNNILNNNKNINENIALYNRDISDNKIDLMKPKTFNHKIKRTRGSGIFRIDEINKNIMNKTDKDEDPQNLLPDIKQELVKVKSKEEKEKSVPITLKKKLSELLDRNTTALVMTIATIYALIFSDINVIFLTPDADIFFNILSVFVFCLFLIEFVLSIFVKDEYTNSFFFWLDLFSILSMLLNIDWIIYPFIEIFTNWRSDDSSITNLSFQKAMRNLSSAIKITRVTRLLRIIRVIRLIRLLKLYKNAMMVKKNREKKKADERMKLRKLEEARKLLALSSDESSVNMLDFDVEEKNNEEALKKENKNEKKISLARRRSIKRRMEIKKHEELSETPYEDILSESKISEKLSTSMTQLIIILIMVLVLSFPYLSIEIYENGDLTNYSILLKYIENYFSLYGQINPELNVTLTNLLEKYVNENYPILNISYNLTTIYENLEFVNTTLRIDEVNYFFDVDGLTLIAFSTYYDNYLQAILNITRTIYIAFILGWIIVKLDEDSKTYALYPLENIMNIIQKISIDPIGSRNMDKLNKKFYTKSNNNINGNPNDYFDNKEPEKHVNLNKKRLDQKENNQRSKSNYEVKTIEAAVIKISALLAIGFGEAGEAIIKHNLKQGTQEVNPMVKGRKKIAIFGFCDIRDFSIVNECLQERTMSFVNQIANIVHTSVDFYMGAANKNIGDAFLCVWKFRNKSSKPALPENNNFFQETKHKKNKIIQFTSKENNINCFVVNPKDKINIDHSHVIQQISSNNLIYNNNNLINLNIQSNNNINIKNNIIINNNFNTNFMGKEESNNIIYKTTITQEKKEEISQNEAADRALLSYLNIIIWINKKRNILVYKNDKDILSRIPEYKVKMGFGLHIGWAIEGAIGSHHKIDASYLSPNVNMSSRLEAATKQYGVSILISGDLYDLLSKELQEICRMIDIVTVKGSKKPIKLYTVDVNLNLRPSNKEQPNINLSENRKIFEEKKQKFYAKVKETGSIGNLIMDKNCFKELLNLNRPSSFKKIFASALDNYINGDWEKGKKYINRALELDPSDGPSKVIFGFLNKHNFKPPPDWKGFRELNSK